MTSTKQIRMIKILNSKQKGLVCLDIRYLKLDIIWDWVLGIWNLFQSGFLLRVKYP
jgi:hypothetical protein